MNEEDGVEASSERDDVAALMRLSGRRPVVPEERAARVKAVARAAWLGQVNRRSRRRSLWAAAALAAAAAAWVAAVALRGAPPPGAAPAGVVAAVRVETLTGPAWSRGPAGDGEARELAVGGPVAAGSELVTAATSRAAIRLASRHSVRLDAATRIRLLDDGSVALEAGAVYVDSGDSGDAGTPGQLEVHTRLGVVEEKGTQFEVRLADDRLFVRLREGAVVLHHQGGADGVQAGNELALQADGSVTRRLLSPHDGAWDWVAGVTPMLDLEGRSARAFLDWAARERGLRLVFADAAVARAAADIVLGGTVRRLTLDEALDAVLPSCRLTYRIEAGELRITSAP